MIIAIAITIIYIIMYIIYSNIYRAGVQGGGGQEFGQSHQRLPTLPYHADSLK